MTTDQISLLAYKNEMPEVNDMTVPQWLLWYRLRDTYRDCAGKPEEGAERKRVWLAQYERDRSDWVKTKEVHEYLAGFWKNIEGPAREFAKNRTVDDAVKFFESVYMVKLKDQVDAWDRRGENE